MANFCLISMVALKLVFFSNKYIGIFLLNVLKDHSRKARVLALSEKKTVQNMPLHFPYEIKKYSKLDVYFDFIWKVMVHSVSIPYNLYYANIICESLFVKTKNQKDCKPY